jgi:hypothetical protein
MSKPRKEYNKQKPRQLSKPHKSAEQLWKDAVRYVSLGFSIFDVEMKTGISISELQANDGVKEAIAARNKAIISATEDAVVCATPSHMLTLNQQIDSLKAEIMRLEKEQRGYSGVSEEYGTLARILKDLRAQLTSSLKLARMTAREAATAVPQKREAEDTSAGLDDFITQALAKKAAVPTPNQPATSSESPSDSDDLEESD